MDTRRIICDPCLAKAGVGPIWVGLFDNTVFLTKMVLRTPCKVRRAHFTYNALVAFLLVTLNWRHEAPVVFPKPGKFKGKQ